MSKATKSSFMCDCGNKISCTVYNSINSLLDRELAEQLINGTLLKTVCPECGKEHRLIYPILYNPGFGKMYQFYPYDDIDEVKKETESAMHSFLRNNKNPLLIPSVEYTADLEVFKQIVAANI